MNAPLATCPNCLGAKRVPLPMTWARSDSVRCPCVVELDVDVEETDEPSFDCTACNGTGEGYGRRCSTCRGSGIDRSAVLAAREEGATW